MALPARISRSPSQHVRREREGMSSSHTDNLALCCCCACGIEDGTVVGHHMMHVSASRGTGLKAPDQWAIPLCMRCHSACHSYGDDETYLTLAGVDARSVARALWTARGDVSDLQRVAFRSAQGARR